MPPRAPHRLAMRAAGEERLPYAPRPRLGRAGGATSSVAIVRSRALGASRHVLQGTPEDGCHDSLGVGRYLLRAVERQTLVQAMIGRVERGRSRRGSGDDRPPDPGTSTADRDPAVRYREVSLVSKTWGPRQSPAHVIWRRRAEGVSVVGEARAARYCGPLRSPWRWRERL